jgi:hypothetical protein
VANVSKCDYCGDLTRFPNICGVCRRRFCNDHIENHNCRKPISNNPYDVLGISEDASKKEVRTRFRELALKYHPDITKDPLSAEKFIKVNQAYLQILKNLPSPPSESHFMDIWIFVTQYFNVYLNTFIVGYLPKKHGTRDPILTPIAKKLSDFHKQLTRTPYFMQSELVNEVKFRELITILKDYPR